MADVLRPPTEIGVPSLYTPNQTGPSSIDDQASET